MKWKAAYRQVVGWNGAITVCGAVLAALCCVAPYRVTGCSMRKTGDGNRRSEWVLALRAWLTHSLLVTGVRPLRRGDVVFYRVPLDEETISEKRVLAVPGDTVEVSWDKICVNGETVYEREEALARFSGLFKLGGGRACGAVLHKCVDTHSASVTWRVSLHAGVDDVMQVLSERLAWDYTGLVEVAEGGGFKKHVCLRVPHHACFVMGDASTAYDSRFHGFVPDAAVVHLVVGRLY